MDNITNKVNGNQVDADEWNQLADIDNFISSAGLTPSTGDLNQIGKASARYSAGSDFYTDGGSANTYNLTPVNNLKSPVGGSDGYFNGMKVRFRAGNNNTGASTVNISSFGSKSIKKEDGVTNISAGDIVTTRDAELRYDLANDCFILRSILNEQQLLNKNILINGAMSIDQRNAGSSQTITAGSSLAYTIDRWYAYCTGANVVGQRVAGSSPNQYNYRFTGASSVTKIGFAQRIEAINSQHVAGKTASLSVDLSNSLLTTVTWTMFYANTVDTFGSLASPTRTQISTGTFTVNSTLTRYNTSISIPSNATTGIEIEFSVGSQTSGTFTIGRAQLELGSVATNFDYRNIQQEIALCQRYFEKTYNLEIALGTNTNIGARVNGFQNLLGNGSNSQFYSHFLSVRKRATPSIVLYSIAGTVGKATQDDGSEINSSAGNVSELSFYTTSINTSGRYSATQHFVATSEL